MAESNKRKKRKAAPKEETPEQRTKRLMEYRVTRADKNIRSLAALAGASYTLKENQKIWALSVLKEALSFVSKGFQGETSTTASLTMPE